MGWFQKMLYGVDLDAEQNRSDELDRQLAAQNQAAKDRGIYSDAMFNQAEADRQAGVLNVQGEVAAAFDQGLSEGYTNVTGTIKSVAAAPFKFAWDSLPWQLMLVGAGFAFYYLGGFIWLKGFLARRK